ncbi:hypothetical protein CUR178_05621 [Leishmania enriettii]|uniref:Uncharacterized protein n=1 Tax=Leishmania enriettii TaxID=5663 RepID=A0A836KR43_LEIEN|nr:hypothetical protein CUR178_05621 [Leishmania enriettii]
MMQRAGVPLQLIRLLERVPVPVSETSRHLVSRAVTVLQTMAQSPCVRAQLRVAAADAAPLVYQNTSYISLLRTLFISEDDDRTPMPAQLLADVVKCLYGEHSASAAIEFLSDWLTARSSSVHAMAQRQQQVWRAMVSDPQAERCIQLRHSWCSDRGCELRERLLTSDDCYEATGRVCTHLELCRLLCLVANGNELVRADEMRREVFGQRSLDALLQVTADAHVPVYFRYPYVQLLQPTQPEGTAALHPAESLDGVQGRAAGVPQCGCEWELPVGGGALPDVVVELLRFVYSPLLASSLSCASPSQLSGG